MAEYSNIKNFRQLAQSIKQDADLEQKMKDDPVRTISEITVSQSIVEVPNPRQVNSFDINRAACVKRTNDIEFTDGVLTRFKVEKPSEVLGCLSIPANIVKALIGLPS